MDQETAAIVRRAEWGVAAEDWPVAVAAYESLSLLRPLTDLQRLNLAKGYAASGSGGLAREILMLIVLDDRASVETLIEVAKQLESLGLPRLSMEACRRAWKRSPDTAEVHYLMGYYAARCGYTMAVCEGLLRRAIDLDGTQVNYRIALATLLQRMGRATEALDVMRPSVPSQLSDVNCDCCLRRLANLFFDFGDLDNARRCAERLSK